VAVVPSERFEAWDFARRVSQEIPMGVFFFNKYPLSYHCCIVESSVGNFHRSHMAAYMNDLFNTTSTNNSWAIVGTGVMPQENAKRTLLEEQDWLQTLVELDGATGTQSATVLAPMIDFTPITDCHKAFYGQLLNDDIKIVSLTVTEGGYFLNNENKLDLENLNVQHDIVKPDSPNTTFGLICMALNERMKSGRAPFTIMSCDNIPHNGHVTKDVVLTMAEEMYGPGLKDWIQANGAFPNSMVDRITPAATPEITELVQRDYGYEDKVPILCEPFRQWVLEDSFVDGERPELEALETVSIVPDVTPYENMKIRILNGGHASLCYPSALLGLNYVHEAVEHPTIGPFLDVLERKEIIPTLPPVPDTDLHEYWKIIQGRFANPTLQDTIVRNCFDGTNRQPKFIVPVAKDGLKAGTCVNGLALVSALWSRYCQGVTEAGETIAPNDNDWDRLHTTAMTAKDLPTVWLDKLPHVYGAVGQNPVFREAFTEALNSVHNDGVEGAIQMYTAAAKK
jgi:mannitol 2-dehydrogenase